MQKPSKQTARMLLLVRDLGRALAAALPVVLLLMAARPAAAEGTATLVVNGRPVEQAAALVGDDGHLLVSQGAMRFALGLTVLQGAEGEPWTIRGFGRTLQVRVGRRQFAVEGELREATVAPSMQGDELLVPLEMLQAAFEMEAEKHRDGEAVCWVLQTPGAEILDVRQGGHTDRARLVLDLEGPTGFSWREEGGQLIVEVPAPKSRASGPSFVRLLSFDDPLISQVRQGPTGSGASRVEITHNSSEAPDVFSLGSPPRIVVDLLRDEADYLPPEPEVPELPKTPKLPKSAGVLQVRNFGTPRGPTRVFVLNLDPRSEQVEVRPELAGPTINQRAPVKLICTRHRAYAGVNGGFFSYQGPPLGMLVIDGEWIKAPRDERTVLGIAEDGELLMDRLQFKGRVHFSGHGYLELTALNRGHAEDSSLVMYTRRWGSQVKGAERRTRLVVDRTGMVTRVESDGTSVAIPPGGFVLSGNGGFAPSLRKVEVGTVVTVELKTEPAWPKLKHAIGGGPRLVKNGREHITARPEKFRSDVYAGARPRTAAGITKDGRLVLVAVEGGRAGDGGGMTLQELASTMIKLGVEQAMNLDGGGSTTFVVEGRVINRPSDGCARSVSNALLVFASER